MTTPTPSTGDSASRPIRANSILPADRRDIELHTADGLTLVGELARPADKRDEKGPSLSTIRRNLQREHLRRLCTMVLGNRRSPYEDLYGFLLIGGGGSAPADARSLARLHLKEIGGRLDKVLDRKGVTIDDTTRAHLEECRHKIGKVLEANLEALEP